MHLTEIAVRNFRVYESDHSIELTDPKPGKNVYLFGGLNGAGKTSLFSAVVLGLYGADAAGLIFERSSGDALARAYKRYLEESFSFGARAQGDQDMSVRLEMNVDGVPVRVQRTWWFNLGQFEDESLVVYRDGKPLAIDAEGEEDRRRILQEFIEGLAPARVAKFFFFDGEEIRSIAARDPDEAVIEGLNQLLGFHAIRRLVDDLRTLQAMIRREMPGASDSGLVSAGNELDEAKSVAEASVAELEKAEVLLSELRANQSALERDITALFEGRSFESRSEALDALASRERELAAISNEIQSFVADVLALSLPGRLLSRAAKRAKTEAEDRRTRESKRRLRPLRDKLVESVLASSSETAPHLTPGQQKALAKRIREAWAELIEANVAAQSDVFSIFSLEELERVPQVASEVAETARRELAARLARRTHLQNEISQLRAIDRTFEGSVRAQELLERKGSLIKDVLEAEAEVARLTREVAQAEQQVANKQAIVSKLEAQLAAAGDVQREVDVAHRLERAADSFMAELRRHRSQDLAAKTTEMMRRMVHKEDLVNRVEIDPIDFGMRLLDKEGVEMLNLSAGEREIFALSLVWGLARISNRQLPVMIDTPLGRLDQMHRANVVAGFLPMAGEQVLVLATDSEIDHRWYGALKPFIAQEILIEFSDDSQTSALRSGRYLELERPHEGAAS